MDTAVKTRKRKSKPNVLRNNKISKASRRLFEECDSLYSWIFDDQELRLKFQNITSKIAPKAFNVHPKLSSIDHILLAYLQLDLYRDLDIVFPIEYTCFSNSMRDIVGSMNYTQECIISSRTEPTISVVDKCAMYSGELIPRYPFTESIMDVCCFCQESIQYPFSNIFVLPLSLEPAINHNHVESPAFITCTTCSSICHITCVWKWYHYRTNSSIVRARTEFSWPCVYSRYEDYSKSKFQTRSYKRHDIGCSSLALCRIIETFKCDTCLDHQLLKSLHRLDNDTKYEFCTRCFGFYRDADSASGHWVERIGSTEKRWICRSCTYCSYCGCGNISQSWSVLVLPSLYKNSCISKSTKIDLLLCQKCFQQVNDEEYCPVCFQIYENDYSIPMLNCDLCDRWIHLSCDPIYTLSEYYCLETAGETYHCSTCRPMGNYQAISTVIDTFDSIITIKLEDIWNCMKKLGIESEEIVDEMKANYKRNKYPRDGRCILLHPGKLGYDRPITGYDWEYIPSNWLVIHWLNNYKHDNKSPRMLYCCYAKKVNHKNEFIIFDPLRQLVLVTCNSQIEWNIRWNSLWMNMHRSNFDLAEVFGLKCFLLRSFIESRCIGIFYSTAFPYISLHSPSSKHHLQNRESLRQKVLSERDSMRNECSRTNPIPYPRKCSRVHNMRPLDENVMKYYKTFNVAQSTRFNRRDIFQGITKIDSSYKDDMNHIHIVPFTSTDKLYLRAQYQIYRKINGLESDNNATRNELHSSEAVDYNSNVVHKNKITHQSQFQLTFWDLALLLSPIQGIGVFSLTTISSNTIITEYIGEVIGCGLGNEREKEYDRHGIGCYFFKLDNETIIDATKKGNIARYINHSCDPNCYSVNIALEGRKIVLILSSRIIYPLEELTYDYKFSMEDGIRIVCNCGALNCRGYMN